MRDINIDDAVHVELWRGRRLVVNSGTSTLLVQLPKGSMSSMATGSHQSVQFGTSASTSVRLSGSAKKGRVAAIVQAVLDFERPSDYDVWSGRAAGYTVRAGEVSTRDDEAES